MCRNQVEKALERIPLEECLDSLRDSLIVAVGATRGAGREFGEQSSHEITKCPKPTTGRGFNVFDAFREFLRELPVFSMGRFWLSQGWHSLSMQKRED